MATSIISTKSVAETRTLFDSLYVEQRDANIVSGGIFTMKTISNRGITTYVDPNADYRT